MMRRYLPEVAIGLLIAAATFVIYFQVREFGLVLGDDHAHYTHFTVFAESWPWWKTIVETPLFFPYWVPVTFGSHMIDCILFGDNPGLHHLVNLYFHIASALLLFLVLRAMTTDRWQSAFVAALFAVHPLNVSPVAWLGERSIMISTFLCLLMVMAYLYYQKRPAPGKYLLVFILFVLGILARPSVLWFPVILVLLDVWPLGRLQIFETDAANSTRHSHFVIGRPRKTNFFVLMEKIPFFITGGLWVIFSVIFYKNSPLHPAGVSDPMEPVVFVNAVVSFFGYLGKTFFPAGLPLYLPPLKTPHQLLPLWMIIAAVLGFLAITILVSSKGKRYPYLIVGWLWYVLTLVPYFPVCVGQQKIVMERYAYIPLIGIFIILAWGGNDLLKKLGCRKPVAALLAVFILILFSFTSWHQAGHWKNSVTYFAHAVDRRPHCQQTRNNYGEVLLQQGNAREAVQQFKIALGMDASNELIHNHLAVALAETGKKREALKHYRAALKIKPDYVEALNNYANLLVDLGRSGEAIKFFKRALRRDSSLYMVHNNLATVLMRQGEYDKARFHLKKALAIKPAYTTARRNLDRLQTLMNGKSPSAEILR